MRLLSRVDDAGPSLVCIIVRDVENGLRVVATHQGLPPAGSVCRLRIAVNANQLFDLLQLPLVAGLIEVGGLLP